MQRSRQRSQRKDNWMLIVLFASLLSSGVFGLGLLLGSDGCALAFLLFAQFGRQFRAKVGGLEQRANLDFGFAGMRIRATLQPLDRLIHRLDLPEPEAGDEFLAL